MLITLLHDLLNPFLLMYVIIPVITFLMSMLMTRLKVKWYLQILIVVLSTHLGYYLLYGYIEYTVIIYIVINIVVTYREIFCDIKKERSKTILVAFLTVLLVVVITSFFGYLDYVRRFTPVSYSIICSKDLENGAELIINDNVSKKQKHINIDEKSSLYKLVEEDDLFIFSKRNNSHIKYINGELKAYSFKDEDISENMGIFVADVYNDYIVSVVNAGYFDEKYITYLLITDKEFNIIKKVRLEDKIPDNIAFKEDRIFLHSLLQSDERESLVSVYDINTGNLVNEVYFPSEFFSLLSNDSVLFDEKIVYYSRVKPLIASLDAYSGKLRTKEVGNKDIVEVYVYHDYLYVLYENGVVDIFGKDLVLHSSTKLKDIEVYTNNAHISQLKYDGNNYYVFIKNEYSQYADGLVGFVLTYNSSGDLDRINRVETDNKEWIAELVDFNFSK